MRTTNQTSTRVVVDFADEDEGLELLAELDRLLFGAHGPEFTALARLRAGLYAAGVSGATVS